MAPGGPRLRLLGDIGGTNARLALQAGTGPPERVARLACEAYPELAEALAAYLAEHARGRAPEAAALAVAAPVTGDRVAFTNSPWSFSIMGLKRRLGLGQLAVVNDFTAAALSVPRLGQEDLVQVGGGTPVPGAPVAVIGPGTGLGVSGLIPADSGWIPLATEGGHATLAPADDREDQVLAAIRRRFGHASAERALSGQGLVNLCAALVEAGMAEAEPGGVLPGSPEDVTRGALEEGSPLCLAALEMFCAMLGTAASNLALTLGALGGVYIAGGIVPKLGDAFAASPFRRRFEDKGRYRGYLAKIPTRVIVHRAPALLGLATLPDGESAPPA